MYLLRRAAVRSICRQSSRQLYQARVPTTPLSRLPSSTPAVTRAFHQSRIWRADEPAKPVEDIVVEEAVAEELKEEAIEQADAAAKLAEEAVDVAENAHQTAAAAEVVEDAAASDVPAEEIAAAAVETAASAATTAHAARQVPERFPSHNSHAGTSFENIQSNRVLYVGNLFFEVTSQQLEDEFSKFGHITNIRIVTDPRGLSRGFGYIEYATQDAADRAIREANQKVLEGRRMMVQYHVRRERTPRVLGGGDRPPRAATPPTKTLFIGNMSFQMSDRDLNELFRNVRDVLDVRVAIDRRSQQPRGFAHADFVDVEAATRAKEFLEQQVVLGRQLKVDYSTSRIASRPDEQAQ